MGRKSPRIREWLVSVRAALWREIVDLCRWLLIVPLAVLTSYGFIYWVLTRLSGEPLSIQQVAGRLREAFFGGQVLVAVLSGFVGFALEKWRKAAEAEKYRAERRRAVLQELEQLSNALEQKRYGEATTLYRLFRKRCSEGGIWEDLSLRESVQSIWERKSPPPLQTWTALVEGSQPPEPTLPILEALAWGHRLAPRNWEEKGRELVGQLVAPDHLEALVRLFEQAPEAQRSLLRLETIGERLEELEKSAGEDQKPYLATLQNWRKRPPLGIPLPWENIRRPSDPPEFAKWLQQWELQANPFGPGMAESDPSLSEYGYWPSSLEPVRGSRPAMVLGTPGSGRTAAALLLYQKCLFPPASPEEAGAFPVRLELDAWPQNPEGWLERIGRGIAEALLQVCGRDPYALFGAPGTFAAGARLFARFFGSATAAHLRGQGLPEDESNYILSEIEFYNSELPAEGDSTVLWNLLAKARPADLKATYLILDVPRFRASDEDPRIQSLVVLMEMARSLAYRGVFLKLFLPEWPGKLLLDSWPLPPIFLQWSEEDLREMLRLRLGWASAGQVESLQTILQDISSSEDYPPDPDTWLVRSAEGSPRRLVELGNEMLRKAWEKSQGEKPQSA